jgi:hypothetical protein
MLRAITNTNGPVSAAPNPVREAQASGLALSTGAQTNAAAAVATQSPEPSAPVSGPTFRYNSTQFIYRQDIGRIILIGQSPVTGERTIQIPSEEALRAYERTMRSEERQTLLNSHAAPEQQSQSPASPSSASPVIAPAPQPAALPNLQQAVSAVVSANQNSAVVSVSA